MAKVQKHIPLAVRFGRVMESSVKAMSFADRIDQPHFFVCPPGEPDSLADGEEELPEPLGEDLLLSDKQCDELTKTRVEMFPDSSYKRGHYTSKIKGAYDNTYFNTRPVEKPINTPEMPYTAEEREVIVSDANLCPERYRFQIGIWKSFSDMFLNYRTAEEYRSWYHRNSPLPGVKTARQYSLKMAAMLMDYIKAEYEKNPSKKMPGN
ncbi:hypothetical protein B0I75DRAFT_167766 [Yarrowia lipolytica]|uniref:Uncharacterized protein n=1 Tax=Yarrowia lipolytica TaxID=4952 RepID=A0A371C7M5_YARLL|nr:hypothetical protein B0I71DRAFT_152590 [Yarrowia lipolytica]RDW50022.1 hypothetical protein B0I75DRAFT_167766 [Yarrowia lipolytica]